MYPPQGAMREWSLVAEEKRLWQDESAKIAVLVVERCTKQDKRFVLPLHQYSCILFCSLDLIDAWNYHKSYPFYCMRCI